MKIHEIESYPENFWNVVSGSKKWELLNNDRPYQKGDVLRFKEYDPISCFQSGELIDALITRVTKVRDIMTPGFVILDIDITPEGETPWSEDIICPKCGAVHTSYLKHMNDIDLLSVPCQCGQYLTVKIKQSTLFRVEIDNSVPVASVQRVEK